MKLFITTLSALLLIQSVTCFASETPFIVPIDKDGVQRVEIVGGDYFFKPGHIIVKVKLPVELKIRKDGYIVPHSIVINAPEAGITVNESLSRDPKTMSFTPTKTGRYPMFCDKKPPFLASHREKGMEGILEVIE
jgi:plastocyanin domain-containing protein